MQDIKKHCWDSNLRTYVLPSTGSTITCKTCYGSTTNHANVLRTIMFYYVSCKVERSQMQRKYMALHSSVLLHHVKILTLPWSDTPLMVRACTVGITNLHTSSILYRYCNTAQSLCSWFATTYTTWTLLERQALTLRTPRAIGPPLVPDPYQLSKTR